MSIYPAQKSQIVFLVSNNFNIPNKCLDFADIILKKLAIELPKHFNINKHLRDLEPVKQLSYGPIYDLGPVKLRYLKTYIKTNLANSFIQFSKFLARAPLLFVKQPNNSFHLCIDYQGLNNITIKNGIHYP